MVSQKLEFTGSLQAPGKKWSAKLSLSLNAYCLGCCIVWIVACCGTQLSLCSSSNRLLHQQWAYTGLPAKVTAAVSNALSLFTYMVVCLFCCLLQAAKSAGGPTRVEKAKIGLIQFHISPPKSDIENNVVISDYAQVGARRTAGASAISRVDKGHDTDHMGPRYCKLSVSTVVSCNAQSCHGCHCVMLWAHTAWLIT